MTKQDIMFIYYNEGFSDRKIAQKLKISRHSVVKWRNKHGLPNNTLQKQMPRPSKGTLCINCIHAYGNDCLAIPIEERTWVKSYVTVIANRQIERLSHPVNFIHECERYQRQKRRVPLTTYSPERMAAQEALFKVLYERGGGQHGQKSTRQGKSG